MTENAGGRAQDRAASTRAIVALPFAPPGRGRPSSSTRSRSRSSCRWATSGRSASRCRRTSCPAEHTILLERRPLLSRPGARRLSGAQSRRRAGDAQRTRSRRCATWSRRGSASRCCRATLDAEYRSRLVVPVPFTQPSPRAARRARASQELSAARRRSPRFATPSPCRGEGAAAHARERDRPCVPACAHAAGNRRSAGGPTAMPSV